jgi:gamma-glutamyltranspeptidase/glutathione hydrolase
LCVGVAAAASTDMKKMKTLRSLLLATAMCAGVGVGVSAPAHAAMPAPAVGSSAMAATAHPLATQAALDILAAGGTAADAAIAATLTISVVEPFSAGIGGGGFAMHFNNATGQMQALDFRETAPAAATKGSTTPARWCPSAAWMAG